MKHLFFALVITLFGFSTFAQTTNKLLSSYVTLKNALVSDDTKAASEAVMAFQQSLAEEGDFAQKEALHKATETMAKAGGIDKQRAAFNDISIAMWKVVKGAEKTGERVYYQYCPMKKAYWLSKEKEIKNPYYGSAMLTCGSVVETK